MPSCKIDVSVSQYNNITVQQNLNWKCVWGEVVSTWLHLHSPITISHFITNVIQPNLSWLCFFPVKGCWKYCSLMRGCEPWHALTAWPILLMASLRPDFRPVEGELSTGPREPLPFPLRAGNLPRRSATVESRTRTEWIHRSSFSWVERIFRFYAFWS